jgi:hypothetical protein
MTIDLDAIRERHARLDALADQDATSLKGTAWVSAVAMAANVSAGDVPDLIAEVELLRAANANLIKNAEVLADEVLYVHTGGGAA